MNKDQWTVTGLILVLVLLEVGRSKTVRDWFRTLYGDFTTALGGTPPSGKSSTPGGSPQTTNKPVDPTKNRTGKGQNYY